jgi:Xaa-Pro dipeptidase
VSNATTTEPIAASPPFLSRAEYERRLRGVRERMAKAGLDVLVLPASANRWEQSMADSRYISGIGGFGTETLTIVPREGDPTAYLFNRAGWWKSHPDNWIADVRDGRNRWTENIVGRLKELGFTKGTIGLSGLNGQNRTPDGTIAVRTYENVRAAFPDATFADATELIQEMRSIKSAEEVGILERAAAVTDRMVEAMVATAAPGVSERAVHAAIVHAMLLAGGELPSLLIFASGPGLTMGHGQFVPVDRILRDGDLLVNELEGRIAGYGAQTVAPVWIGKPDPKYRVAVDLATTVFDAVLGEMRPGATMGGLMDVYYKTIEREGKGAFTGGLPLMHARGLGDEVPAIIDAEDLKKNGGTPIAENMVFVVKPRVRAADGAYSAQVGDTVVVTPSGGRRLGKRKLGLYVVG